MAHIFKNPNLKDYFHIADGVTAETPLANIPSFVQPYEDGKVLYFPNLRFNIDFDFWAKVPSEQFEGFKKMLCYVDHETQPELIARALKKANGPPELYELLWKNMSELFRQVMPIYYRIFAGYQYSIKRAVWRLNTTLNENLHFDTYKDSEIFPEHFARMFINLDNQPRIWHTSYTVDEVYEKFGRKVSQKVIETTSTNRFWRELNHTAFGKGHEWWDGSPRHVIYFEPGDVWVVDSRQVSHQIYYGRRAISIDFVVTRDSMQNPKKHYLDLAETYREGLRGGRQLLVTSPAI
ncbi:hypothetical protein MMA231_03474 (plasmid) [Asticcacaulis sp. MM231]|uniref:Kdo hydroxylase family protein n=1 Tax=Asticcacaulis sp. MM231 TaxID=3157666 RepID=UPI0032D57D46